MTKPYARNDFAKIGVLDSDGKIGGNLLSNDTPADSNPLYLRFVDGIRVGDKGVDTIQGTYGTFTFNADGTFVYALDPTNSAVQALQHGQTLSEHLNYKVSDGSGNTDFGLFNLVIDGPNQQPAAVDDHYALNLGASTTFSDNVLSNDTDSDSDTVRASFIGSVSPLTYIPNNGGDVSYQGQYGTITIGRDGSFVYTADEAKVDAALASSDHVTEHFVYKIWDGQLVGSSDQADIYIDLTHTA